ncbi:MAG: sigma-70 family RNA polymerase sigma factor [Planctomycetes bacterium]|nr:sigma-70 family RNA polymerase sigma factor [Planctomycetota bacterium]
MIDHRLAGSARDSAAHEAAATRARDEAHWRELVAAIARGDQGAMAELYDASQRVVFALVLRVLGERESAEEVLLDVYMQVWRRAASFDAERGHVSTWLLTIARSRALDRRRTHLSRARRESPWSDEREAALADRSCTCEPAAAHESEERCSAVRCAILELPDAQRHAIELAFHGDLSHTEIAERLGLPLGTVKTRIRLGLSKLKDQLKGLEDER